MFFSLWYGIIINEGVCMKKCTIIYNPQSGKKYNKPFLNEFEGILKDNNYETTIISTEYKGHAKEIALNIEECDLVISLVFSNIKLLIISNLFLILQNNISNLLSSNLTSL